MRSLRVFLLVALVWVLAAVLAGAQEVPAYLVSCGARSGELTCVCGWFEDLSGTGVLIDGQPAGPPVSASRNMLCYQLPPGPHRISGDPARFSQVEEHEASVVTVRRSPLARAMKTGMTSPVTWTVDGTVERSGSSCATEPPGSPISRGATCRERSPPAARPTWSAGCSPPTVSVPYD